MAEVAVVECKDVLHVDVVSAVVHTEAGETSDEIQHHVHSDDHQGGNSFDALQCN